MASAADHVRENILYRLVTMIEKAIDYRPNSADFRLLEVPFKQQEDLLKVAQNSS